MDPSPPVYQELPVSASLPDAELPAYATTSRILTEPFIRPLTEHVFELTNRNGRPWATLKLRSSARSSKQLPTYLEGDKIEGSIILNLERAENIEAVVVRLKGTLTTGSIVADPGAVTFMDNSLTLWSQSMGGPSSPSISTQVKHDSKLLGKFVWPFTLNLPTEVEVSGGSGRPKRSFRLPETYMERQNLATIQYDIIAHVLRGKFRPNSKLQAMFAYVPVTRPDPPSILRQLAYQENSPLFGPGDDVDGWETFSPVKFQGMVFKKRLVEAVFVLSLAKPLCYTRGSVIPCDMVIESQDTQALDLLSSPHAVALGLRCRTRYHISESHRVNQGVSWKDSLEDIQSAVWWPSPEGGNVLEPHKRHICGEIRLQKSLKPSMAIAHFSIDYSIVVHPFQAIAFAPADTFPLLEQGIEISTMFARGPRPRSYAPPVYDDGGTRIGDNYFIPPAHAFI